MTVEIRTVNHRFLDLGLKLSRQMLYCEDALRGLIAQNLRRGHADIYVTYRNLRSDAVTVSADGALAKQYAGAMSALSEATGVKGELTLSELARFPDVLTVSQSEEDEEAVKSLLLAAAKEALDNVNAMREREGAALKSDLAAHLSLLESLVSEAETLAPNAADVYRARLEARMRELGAPLDEARITQEAALIADKCAVDEELSRLRSHIAQAYLAMEDAECGKRLDFLTQEMNREANTTGSKAQDAKLTKVVVSMKSEIEKLREQTQNVE